MLRPWEQTKANRRIRGPRGSDDEFYSRVRARILADCHPWQRDAVADPHRLFTWLVGRGGGKTSAFKARFLIDMSRPGSARQARFVYVAPTLGMAVDLLWEPLAAACEALKQAGLDPQAEFKEIGKTLTFRRTNARLRLYGADDKREMAKLRGQPFDGVGMDEVAVFEPPENVQWFLERVIMPRLGERLGWLGLASTPGHILRGPFYDSTRDGAVDANGVALHRPFAHRDYPEFRGWKRWSSHRWNLKDVAELPNATELYPAIVANWTEALEAKEREAYGDDHPVWKREWLGIWAADDTDTVFKYRPERNQWAPQMVRVGDLEVAKLPERPDWVYAIAVDSGAKDPCAVSAFAASPSDPERCIYQVFGYERTDMYAQKIATLLLGPGALENLDAAHEKPGGLIGALGGFPAGMIIDGDELLVSELSNVYGLRFARPNKQTPSFKFGVIEATNGDLLEGRIKVLQGSLLERQLQNLQWKKDDFDFRKEDKAQSNHSSDTLCYARILLRDLFESGLPTTRPVQSAVFRDPMSLDDAPIATGEYDSLLSEPNYAELWGNE